MKCKYAAAHFVNFSYDRMLTDVLGSYRKRARKLSRCFCIQTHLFEASISKSMSEYCFLLIRCSCWPHSTHFLAPYYAERTFSLKLPSELGRTTTKKKRTKLTQQIDTHAGMRKTMYNASSYSTDIKSSVSFSLCIVNTQRRQEPAPKAANVKIYNMNQCVYCMTHTEYVFIVRFSYFFFLLLSYSFSSFRNNKHKSVCVCVSVFLPGYMIVSVRRTR